jgi:serine/threonine-protein kinase RsbW
MRSRLGGAAILDGPLVFLSASLSFRHEELGMDLHKGWKVGPPYPQFELSMPSEISAISPFVDDFMERMKEYTCFHGDASDIEVALREAIANAVLHGNKEDPSKQVHLSFRCEPTGELFFVVRDEGPGFDPDKVPDPLAPENLDAEHGRGILMMRSYMDHVHYDCGGTECHMHKKPPSAKPAR